MGRGCTMTFTDLRGNAREFFIFSYQNKYALLALLLYVPLVIDYRISFLLSYAYTNGLQACLADCFCFVIQCKFFGFWLLPLFCIWVIVLLKNDFSVPFVIRQKNKRQIWLKQSYKVGLSSFFFTLYVTVWTAALGLIRVKRIYNWVEADSFFFTPDILVAPPDSIMPVAGMFFVLFAFYCAAMGLLQTWLQWLSDSAVLGLGTVMLLLIVELRTKIRLFYGASLMDHDRWHSPVPITNSLLCPFLWIMIIVFCGWITSKRKDLFGAQQKQTSNA